MIKTIALFLFIVGVYMFGMSYHNIDLAVNAVNGSIDTNGFGFKQDKQQMYMNGMSGMNVSVILLIGAFAMIFGVKEKLNYEMEKDKLFTKTKKTPL